MGISRSSFYEEPLAAHDDTAIVEAIAAICGEFEFYGWRRVRAELRHRDMIVNHKKIRRLMREHGSSAAPATPPRCDDRQRSCRSSKQTPWRLFSPI
jgi:hypothetical protein